MLRSALLAPLLALALAAPASAAATDFYVDDNGAGPPTPGCQDSGHPCTTIATALTASRALPGTGDTINLAAGTYNEDVVIDQAADNGLTIDGVRSGLTTSTISHVSGSTHAVQFGSSSAPLNTGLTLKDLVITVAPGGSTSKYGIDYYAVNSKLDNVGVVISDTANTVSAIAAVTPSGTTSFDDVVVVNQGTGAGMTVFSLGGHVDIANSGIAMSATVSTANGLLVFGDVDLTDTLVRLPAGSAATAVSAVSTGTDLTIDSSLIEGGRNGVLVQQSAAGTAKATIRRSTVDAATAGVDDGAITGASANASTQTDPDAVATVVVVDSLLVDRPTGHAVSSNGTPTVTCTNTLVPLTTNTRVACDTPDGNRFATPAEIFVDASTLNYQLSPSSPAIDAGSASGLFAGEPNLDQAGKPRSVDGNFDCAARPDLGARELQGQDNTAPVATAAGPATGLVGEALSFTATGTDAEDPAPAITWAFSDGAAATGTPAPHAFATAGAQAATVTVTDSRGCHAAAKVDITVSGPAAGSPPPAPPSQEPGADTTAPAITAVSVKKRTLRFTLSEAAATTVRVARRACARVKGKRRCRRRTIVTRKVAGTAGINRFTLPSRASTKGRYRVTIAAVDAAGNRAKPGVLGFTRR